jgi:hypothetical protein
MERSDVSTRTEYLVRGSRRPAGMSVSLGGPSRYVVAPETDGEMEKAAATEDTSSRPVNSMRTDVERYTCVFPLYG